MAVEKVTGGYAAVLRRSSPRRTLTLAVIGGFAAGICCCQHAASAWLYPGRGPGHLYGSSRRLRARRSSTPTPSPTSLEAIAKEIEEVTSVSSLAGYEVLTEGRGSNAGTCIINLKHWSERKLNCDARSLRNSRKNAVR